MILNVSATYLPDADEVWVQFDSTENDGTTQTVADEVLLRLQLQTTDQIGAKSYHDLYRVSIPSDMVRPGGFFEMTFRNPERTMDLFIEAEAKFGSSTFTKKQSVGLSDDPRNSMDLPDNPIYTKDPLAEFLTGGGNIIPNENDVILQPPLQNTVIDYDFVADQPVEEYAPLVYSGGGERLLLHKQTNQFVKQNLDQAPWAMSSYLFMEPARVNLCPNPWFLVAGTDVPASWEVDAAGALFYPKLDFNFQVSADARLWTMRFRQANEVMALNQAVIRMLPTEQIAITAGEHYTFSTYVKVRRLTLATQVEKLQIALRFYQGGTFLSETVETFQTQNLKDLGLVAGTGLAPVGADNVRPEIRLGSIDSGDDVELQVLGFSLEAGVLATSRLNAVRQEDVLVVPDYLASNQKIRLRFVAGFDSGSGNYAWLTGPLQVDLLATGDLSVQIPGQGTVTVPLSFSAGDLLDITIAHESGKTLSVYRDGTLLADTSLPSFTAIPADLSIRGVGGELVGLSVFSRQNA